MPCVVVIEPDTRQAAVIKRIVRDRARAELVLVDSKDAALAAIHRRVPDLILATTLMAPRDGAALAAYLRDLPGATHLQILTIPLLAPAEPRKTARRGLLKSLKRTPDAPLSAGCDPEVFGDEVEAYLKRASELREDHEKVVTQRSNMERRGKTKIERVIVPSEPPEPIPPTLRKAVEPAPFAGPRRIEPPVVPAPEMVEAGANRTVAIAETQTSPDRDSVQDAAPDVDSLAPVETPASETGESSTSEPDAAATRRVASFDAAEPLKAGVEAESEVSLAAPEPGVVDQPPSSNVASQDELPVIVAGPAPVLSAEPEVVSDLVGDAAKDPVEESVPEPLTIAEGSFPGVEEISAAPVETPPTNERRLEVAPVADETSIAGDLATPAGGPATIEDVGSPAPPEPKGVDELVVEPVNIGEPIVEMLRPDESAANVAVHEVAGKTVQVGEQIAEGASGGESLVEVANLVEQAPAAARVDQRIAEAGIVVSRVVETETIDEQVMPATPVASQAVEAATLEERTPEPATGDEAVVRAQSDQADPNSSVLEIRTLDAQTIDRIMNQPAEPELDSILAIIAALRQERPPLQEDRRAIVEPKTIPVPAPVDEGESGPRLVTKATAPRKRSRRRPVEERKPDSTAPLGQMTAAPAEQAIRAGSGSRTGTKLRLKPPSEGPGGRSDEASLLGTTRTSFTCDDVGLRGWLAPLAKWTRRASDIEWHWVDPNPPRPKEDDVQALLKGMGVPYHVAGVTYGTGCRIGRVRVRRRGRKTSDGPLIILSRRTLAELRSERQSTLDRASR